MCLFEVLDMLQLGCLGSLFYDVLYVFQADCLVFRSDYRSRIDRSFLEIAWGVTNRPHFSLCLFEIVISIPNFGVFETRKRCFHMPHDHRSLLFLLVPPAIFQSLQQLY